jgi:hypothetical protein
VVPARDVIVACGEEVAPLVSLLKEGFFVMGEESRPPDERAPGIASSCFCGPLRELPLPLHDETLVGPSWAVRAAREAILAEEPEAVAEVQRQ